MHIDIVEISNFRRLQSVRVGLSKEKTVFVGANNSGKSSAMLALRYFLMENERKKLSLNDITLSRWPVIDSIGEAWEGAHVREEEMPLGDWTSVLPFLDVWLAVSNAEVHYVQKLIPTLDWEGERLGVRLRLEPRDISKLQQEFLSARSDARTLQALDAVADDGVEAAAKQPVTLWPKSLTEFLQRRLGKLFTVQAYILDPTKLVDPTIGVACPQALASDAEPVDGDPLKGLIRIDEISAQRGFGQTGGSKDPDDEAAAAGASATRKMSEQLRHYWNRHLDPHQEPDAKDLRALKAIEDAQRAFDERLREGFAPALEEVEGLGYPGITDPRLNISTQLKPVNGLNHETAVQYMIQMVDGANSYDLSLPEESNGLGYQNLISMVFRLMSFRDAWMRVGKAGLQQRDGGGGVVPPVHLVLIEEPEAHLHTQVQQVFIRQAYRILRKHPELSAPDCPLTSQMIVSTHSSHIAHQCAFDTLRYFRRLPASAHGVPISCVVDLGRVFGADQATKRFVTRYLNVTHSDLFFADAAVLVEGPAERILVPYFVRNQSELHQLGECYVTWLEIGGSHAHRLRSLIEHLGLITLVVTDLDAMGANRKSVVPARGSEQKSRNATLSGWWPKADDLDALLDLDEEQKVKSYVEECFNVRVAYQCPIEIEFKDQRGEAIANTLEDALVYHNISLIAEMEGGSLLSRFRASIEKSATINELADALFEDLKGGGGKAEFALDLLEIENPQVLQPPLYIKEGLLWLAAQLRRQQQDIGVATSLPVSEVEGQAA
jgi:predicted ATP-dependent endonuclease of OLD family